jgi:transcriptional regulator of acetoin/glycerol metabolism
VPRDELLTSLVQRLVAATWFEEVATAVLEAMFASVEAAFGEDPPGARARLLRGVVHMRPDGSYEQFFGLDHRTRVPVEGVGYVTSGNVWTWIEEHRCAVSIDVQRGALCSWLPDGPVERLDQPHAAGLPGEATRERMLERDATHVHVLPLRAPGGSVDGMITLEASCKAASTGRLWEACQEALDTLAGVAGAFIAGRTLPLRAAEPVSADKFLPVVGRSTSHLVELLRAFARRDDTILISGPMGAGKSRLARWCHEHSQRKGQPFEVVGILSVPEDLQMAELFGWKRGAFTGAFKDTPGAIARAAKGTLFLDEIDKLSLQAQAGLLRFIEARAYRMLGDDSDEDRSADVRLLVGTNADLRAAVRAGRFREDLYWRINVLPVRLLPLGERIDELPAWAAFMLDRRHREAGGEGVVRLEPDAVKLLASVPWPGNLRQLDNILRRAYALLLDGQTVVPGGPGGDLVVRRSHVERALTFDGDTEKSALAEVLRRAASAFVQEAQRRKDRGRGLQLDLTDGFQGMVLGAAIQATGSRDEAFVLFGEDRLVKNRNHHRAVRREILKACKLLGVLGDFDRELEALLDGDEEAGEGR